MPPAYYLGLCAIAKDETPFLREWVGYHHYIGFEKIYVYDNESSVPVRDTAADFYDLGVFDSYRLQGKTMQLTAYHHCLKHHGHEFEWLAFFDLDEFLCLKRDCDARVFVQDYEAYSGISINWDIFSSSGFLGSPQGMVTGNYRQSLGYTVNCKCIVRPARVKLVLSPHHFLFHEGISVNADKEPAVGAYAPLAIDRVCLNHYWTRSQQDYEDKIRRGDAVYDEQADPRSLNVFYGQAAKPVVEKSDILPLAEETEQMLAASPPRAKYDICFADVARLPLSALIKNIVQMMHADRQTWAEVLFALGRALWKAEPAYLNAGILLYRQTAKFDRAVSLARELIALTPDQDAYFILLQCLAEGGKIEEATRIADFLEEFASLNGKCECGDKVRRYRTERKL